MSRFATPNKSRPLVVAISPSIPVQREPGHRYANGIQLPGPSFKGRHVIEIKVNGVRMHSPTRERPNSPERSTSPGGTVKDLQSTHKVVSMADSYSLPKSTTKPFIPPERTRRGGNSSSRSLTTSALSEIDLTAGKSINTGRNSTPTQRLSRDVSVNSEVVSVNGLQRSSSAQSVRSSSNRSVSSGVSSISGTAYGNSVRSFSAGRSVRSQSPIQYLTGGQHSSLSNASAQIHQSLASSKRLDVNQQQHNIRNANKLELSQSAYRHFRKAVVRDAIHNFLQGEENHRYQLEDLGIGDDDVDESLNDLLDMSIAGGGMKISNKHGESGDDHDDDDNAEYAQNAQHPTSTVDMNRTIMTSKMAMGKEDRRKFRRLHKMIKLLRQSIVDDLNLQGLTLSSNDNNSSTGISPNIVNTLAPETLFFPSQHMHSVMVAQSRQELLSLIVQWRQLYTNSALSALDRYYATWVTARSQRLQAQRAYQASLQQYKQQEQTKQKLRQEITQLRIRAQDLGLVLPANLFPAELGLESPPLHSNDNNNMNSTSSSSGNNMMVPSLSPSAIMGTGQLRYPPHQSQKQTSNQTHHQPQTNAAQQMPAYDATQSVFLSPKAFIQSNIRALAEKQTPQFFPPPLLPSPSQQTQSQSQSQSQTQTQPAFSPQNTATRNNTNQNNNNNANNNTNNNAPLPSPNVNRGRFSYGANNNNNNNNNNPPTNSNSNYSNNHVSNNPPPAPAATRLGEGKMSINLDVLRVLNSPNANAPVSLSVSSAASMSATVPAQNYNNTTDNNASNNSTNNAANSSNSNHNHTNSLAKSMESPTTAVRKHLSTQHAPNLHTLMYSPIHAQQGASQFVQPVYTNALNNNNNNNSNHNNNTSSTMSHSTSPPPPPPPVVPTSTNMSPLGMVGSKHMQGKLQNNNNNNNNNNSNTQNYLSQQNVYNHNTMNPNGTSTMTQQYGGGGGASIVSALSTTNNSTAMFSANNNNMNNMNNSSAAYNMHLAVTKDPKIRARYNTINK